MAQYYNAKEVSEKLENQLKICEWKSINNGESFQIELPVVLYFNYQRLVLNIYPIDDGYCISDDGQTFLEHSFDTKYYYDLFNKKDKSYHFDVQLKDDYICKNYRFDYSLMSAIDEFIRYFILLDEFMRKNDIT
ncbi:MAG: hypothetical protein J6V71_03955 [Clostridia bacterium]|nr:hypothetical protein [Clostridia bacterium]